MLRLAFSLAALLGTAAAPLAQSLASRANPAAPPTAYVGGTWWDGETFAPRDTVWAEGGVFAADRPGGAVRVVDLGGAFVVPPFGDAHYHGLDHPDHLAAADSQFVAEGVFYVQNPNNRRSDRDQVRGTETVVDVVYANGGITAPGAHPVPAYERQALGLSIQEMWDRADELRESRLAEGDAYHLAATVADLDVVWPEVLAGRPDLVKVYLLGSEEWAEGTPERPLGLSPAVAAEVVRRAHAAGLRVVAHVETAADVRAALDAGVDGLAHLPSYNTGGGAPSAAYVMDDALVADLAASGTPVTPTFARGPAQLPYVPERYRPSAETQAAGRQFHRDLLRQLAAAGVPLALGADLSVLTVHDEAAYAVEIGGLTPTQALRALSVDTPRAVFPDRAVGRLAEGFEASLLALACDPTADFACTGRIVRREKQGEPVGPPAPRLNPAAPPTAYVGGSWWDGERFAPRDTTWAEGGVFTDRRPARVERAVSLAGRFVVPPYGDAHQHMLDGAYTAGLADSLFLDRGVFYALVLNNSGRGGVAMRPRFAGPATLDVAYAHGGITSTGSHPAPLYERIARNAALDADAARDDTTAWSRLGDTYWFWDTLADVEAEWDAYLAFEPDVVKAYLTYSAACDDRPTPRGCGLRPEVLAEVVRRAHAAGLPVVAHVNTDDDVRRALAAGVDALAHLPSGNDGISADDERYWLSAETRGLLAASGATAIPTASLLFHGRGGAVDLASRDTLQAQVARQRAEYRALLAAGVPLALGADRWMMTSEREADYLVAQDVLDAATVLDLWTRTTPQTAFPGRAVGRLASGFEASLLALDCDPTADWSCTERIAHREKQGLGLGGADMSEAAAAWRALDVAVFTVPPAPGDGPLLRGLKAYADADWGGAEAALREALAAAPDALRPFVRARLADVACERFDWAEAVALRSVDDPGAGRSVEAGFARFPAPRLHLDAPETTVPFDGLRVPAAVNGVPVQAIVDTGASGTGVPRALVERLGLRPDTTARGRSVVPSMGLAFDTYAVLLDSVTVGAATFYDVPASVAWRDDGATDDDEVFLGAALLRHLAGAVRYDYADSTFTVIRDRAATAAPPTFVVEPRTGAPALQVRVGGAEATAVVDTGNQASVYLAEGAFDVPDAAFSRTVSGTLASGYEWSHRLYRLPFEVPGHPVAEHEAYEAGYIFSAADPVTVILGKTVWAGGVLTVDFVNRRVRFEPAEGGADHAGR